MGALLFYFSDLSLPCVLKAALTDEFYDIRQFVGIKPNAMGLANVNNDARRVGKIISVHQLAAFRAGNISDLRACLGDGPVLAGETENCGLSFAVSANVFKGFRVRPHAAAFFALAQHRLADLQDLHLNFAPGTLTRFIIRNNVGFDGMGPAMAAKLISQEH